MAIKVRRRVADDNEMPRPQRASAAVASLVWTADARPPSVQPAAPVGSRIRVFWQADQAWYSGTIKAYTDAVDTHLVVYDDGDQRNEALSDPSLKVGAAGAASLFFLRNLPFLLTAASCQARTQAACAQAACAHAA